MNRKGLGLGIDVNLVKGRRLGLGGHAGPNMNASSSSSSAASPSALVVEEIRRLGVHMAARNNRNSRRRQEFEAKPTMHRGTEVCVQRWSLARFFKPTSDALWFCYLPAERIQYCEEGFRGMDFACLLFYAGSLLLLVVLARIMYPQSHFVLCIEWLATLALNLETAIYGVKILIDRDMAGGSAGFSWTAMGIVIVGSNLLFLPYSIVRRCGEVGQTLGLLYLLVIVYSPAVFLDRMTYYQSFPLLMGHQPAILGLFGFSVEVARALLCSGVLTSGGGDGHGMDGAPLAGSYAGGKGGDYAPMHVQNSMY